MVEEKKGSNEWRVECSERAIDKQNELELS